MSSKKEGTLLLFKTIIYLGIESVSCRLLLRMAKMDMDWNLKMLGHRFHARKNHQFSTLLQVVLPDEICVLIKVLSNDFSTELT